MLIDLGLAVMKAFTLATLTVCPLPPQVPKVNIYFFPKPPVHITEAPMMALTEAMKKGSPNSTAASHKGFIVFGLTETAIADGGTRVGLMGISDNEGNTCLGVEKVDMVIHYQPTVFVAKELKDFPCQLAVTQMHEDQHVAFDREVMTDYIPKIKMEVLWHLRSLGMMGPYNQSEVPQKRKEIMQGIIESSKPMLEKLRKVREAKQGSIDTVENYKAESMKCPDERAKLIEMLKDVLK
jgi:hypothetical protein